MLFFSLTSVLTFRLARLQIYIRYIHSPANAGIYSLMRAAMKLYIDKISLLVKVRTYQGNRMIELL
jgi:hypothetical protein